MLLLAAWKRVLVASVAVAIIWAAVLWVSPSTPSTAPVRNSTRIATRTARVQAPDSGDLRRIIETGSPAPGGGRFDRFDVPATPVAAPVNGRGQVAFFATVLHAPGREGIFLADAGTVSKVAAFGDDVPGGGTLAEIGAHPLPALNSSGHVAFVAEIAGGHATEGVFLAGADGLQVIALAGDDAPGIPAGVMIGFSAPALNDNDELAFVTTVRRGRDVLDVLYFWNGRRLQRVIAEGDRLIRIGGVLEKIGEPALNNSGVIAFPAAIFKGPALAGVFVAGGRDLRLLVRAGEQTPSGSIIQRFAERVAIDDDGAIAFGAYLGQADKTHEGVLLAAPEGLSELAIEGAPAPGGGRFAGFGPWPTIGPDGSVAFVAALDEAAGPLGVFAGMAGDIRRIAIAGEMLPGGGVLSRFALNAVADAGPEGAVTFTTAAETPDEPNVIYCRCPASGP